MSSEPESFLVRWSRRKREAVREPSRAGGAAAPQPAPTLPSPPAAVEAAATAPEMPVAPPSVEADSNAATAIPLPPIESLDGLRSDYEAFFKQPVAEELRRAAVKKLFADPHFNKMDMLDVYVDDYTQFEPLPAELRMRLTSARPFLSELERAALEAAENAAGTAGDAIASAGAASGNESEAAAGSGDDGDAGRTASSPSGADAGSTLTAASEATTADASSAERPTGTAHASSASADPDSSSAAPEPRLT